jgi:hypothetical protein
MFQGIVTEAVYAVYKYHILFITSRTKLLQLKKLVFRIVDIMDPVLPIPRVGQTRYADRRKVWHYGRHTPAFLPHHINRYPG